MTHLYLLTHSSRFVTYLWSCMVSVFLPSDSILTSGNGVFVSVILDSIGLKLLKYLLFLCNTRPLPSTFTAYLSSPSFSITSPVQSHRLDCFPAPCWFIIRAFCPGFRSSKAFVCSAHLSLPGATLCRKANSRWSLAVSQTSDVETSLASPVNGL